MEDCFSQMATRSGLSYWNLMGPGDARHKGLAVESCLPLFWDTCSGVKHTTVKTPKPHGKIKGRSCGWKFPCCSPNILHDLPGVQEAELSPPPLPDNNLMSANARTALLSLLNSQNCESKWLLAFPSSVLVVV